MRQSLGIVLLFGLALPGVALELYGSLVRFPHEPLVVYTELAESEPVLRSLDGGVLPAVAWQKEVLPQGRIRWIAHLEGVLPEGIWSVATDQGCWTFLLVSPLCTIVEIFGSTEQTVKMVTAAGQTYVGATSARHPLTFVVKPAYEGEKASISSVSCPSYLSPSEEIVLRAGTRLRVSWPPLALYATSREALPGTSVVIGFAPVSGIGVLADLLLAPLDSFGINLPSGWELEPLPQTECCAAYDAFVPWFAVHVPASAEEGTYEIRVGLNSPEFFCHCSLQIRVVWVLSPKEVVGHWNVREEQLDLTQPYAITYERLLWAASLLGQKIPYTETIMTEKLLQQLAEEWRSSPAQHGED